MVDGKPCVTREKLVARESKRAMERVYTRGGSAAAVMGPGNGISTMEGEIT